ncbi:MAG TPA: 4-hydroxy-tetrahydrodipicolinate reductase, partial [Dissulfurispiraceae bacterium]|nr:4-hydroxy-tetrahydrodipicolinate reductase [Dissulfurispiraceae bacterium]
MTRIIVTGAAGRMGSRIIAFAKDYAGLKLVGALERQGHESIGKDVGLLHGLGETNILIRDDLSGIIDDCDAVIDFTGVSATLDHVKTAADRKKAMVIGTTGLKKDEIAQIASAAAGIPVVLAPNMSVGVNLLLRVLRDIAQVLGDDYDVEVIEAHHRMKKDAPSGTALKMAQVIAEALNRDLDDVATYARKGLIGERQTREIGIQTIRAGDIVGEHTVLFGGLGERIEIIHRVSSR